MNVHVLLAAMLLSLMPYAAGAQGTEINSRDLRGKVVYQDDEVVFRQLDDHTWIGNGHRVYNESLYLVRRNGHSWTGQDCSQDYFQACHDDADACPR